MQTLNKVIYWLVLAVVITLIVILARHYNSLVANADYLQEELTQVKKDTCHNLIVARNRVKLVHENLVNDVVAQYANAGSMEAKQKRTKDVTSDDMTAIYNSIDATETKIKEQEKESNRLKFLLIDCQG